jgi:TetR/AcrR family transcriptional regulator, cholesterol catabolism regulator
MAGQGLRIAGEHHPVGVGDAPDAVIVAVVELLETEGYEAVQLREVARRARVSMTTIYRRYPTREALIVGALRWWMDENRYAGVAASAAEQLTGSMYDDLMALFRTIFQPWEQNPRMLRAYFRAQAGPGGQGLTEHGFDVVVPVARTILAQADPAFASDMEVILSGLIYGLLGQFADDAIAATDILPALDRAVFWLTASQNTMQANSHRSP